MQKLRDQKRILEHELALKAFETGNYKSAEKHLNNALALGENIAILRDLAVFYHQTGSLQNWRQAWADLSARLDEVQSSLSLSTKTSVELLIAKFFEEEGMIYVAIEKYQKLYDEMKAAKRSDLFHSCLPQLLRLKSCLGISSELGALYAELLILKPSLISASMAFEVQHSLMLAEMALVGSDHAWFRVCQAIANGSTPMADRRLIFYDFLEEHLVRQLSLPENAAELSKTLVDLDVFESRVHGLAFGGIDSEDIISLSQSAAEMPWASHIRIVSLYLAHSPPRFEQELINKLNLLLAKMDAESRGFWLSRVSKFWKSNRTRLEFSRNNRALVFNDRRIDLSKKRSLVALIEVLAQEKSLHVERAIDRLWQSGYSPETYHRLRMTVHRLNQIIFDLTATPKAIEVSADTINLRSSFELVAP